MNDNLYSLQINEIDGEIASLKITLKTTNYEDRRKELEKEIEKLEEQRNYLMKNFKGRYKSEPNRDSEAQNSYEDDDGFSGPQKPNTYEER